MTDTRYNNGKIYKLVSNHTDKVYIGSTIQKLSSRISGHRKAYNRYLNGKANNITSFNLICFPDCKIYLIESVSCNNRAELEKRERFYIESMECCNKYIPGRTYKEYREDNKDKIKQYYQTNKDKIEEQRKEYQKNNAVAIKKYHKKYKIVNKEKISNNAKEKIECNICKSIVRKYDLNRHKKSKKCLSCVQ